jgi:hypothetical protein
MVTTTILPQYSCKYCGADVTLAAMPCGEDAWHCTNQGCQFVAMLGTEDAALNRKPTPPSTPSQRKAALYLIEGVRAVKCGAGWLVPSATRSIVHYVERETCSCEASQCGRSCWHTALVAQQLDARRAA